MKTAKQQIYNAACQAKQLLFQLSRREPTWLSNNIIKTDL